MTPTPVLSDISRQLSGYTSLRRMEYSLSSRDGEYDLLLVLAKGQEEGAPAVVARFQTVSKLSVEDFGGGLTQLLLLLVEDVSSQQWDRVRYRVHDAERGMISFYCQVVAVASESVGAGTG